jgi:phosphohistidine swiveling domain-containing protein
MTPERELFNIKENMMTNYEIASFTERGEPLQAVHPFIKTFDQIEEGDRPVVGGKALHLATMAGHGIAVPDGVCVSAAAYDQYTQDGFIDQSLISELEDIRQSLGGQVAVRSSATCEDGADVSMAGVFDTHYLFEDGQDIDTAMKAIYEQSRTAQVADLLALHGYEPSQVKMGLVVQRLVQADRSGVLYTDVAGDNMLAQYVDGLGADLVDGLKEGSSILVNQAGTITQSKGFTANPLTAEHVAQLNAYAKTIKQLFGGLPQDIEFAVEDGRLQILQARPLTTELNDIELRETPAETLVAVKAQIAALVRAEKDELGSDCVIFSDSNFSELMPRPKEMDIGIFAYIFTGSDGVAGAIQIGRKHMNYPLGDQSIGYMRLIGGKPYFSLAKDAHTFYAGFPASIDQYNESFVAEYLRAVDADPSKGEYPEMGLYVQDPTLEQLQERFGDQAETYYASYLQFRKTLAGHADTFMGDYKNIQLPAEVSYLEGMAKMSLQLLGETELQGYIFDVLEHLRTQSCVNFVKAARLGFYYSQRLQNYLRDELAATPDQVEDLFSKLTQGLNGSAITDTNLAIANAPSFEDALAIGRGRVGHYSTGEMLEIRHPRLSEGEESLRTYVEGIYQNRDSYIGEFAKQQQVRKVLEKELRDKLGTDKTVDFDQIVTATQTYMALRETAKYYFVREYGLVRNALLELSGRLGLEPEAIFSVYPRELPQLAADVASFKLAINERQQAFANYAELEMPAVIRESDIANLELVSDKDESAREMVGKLLAQGALIESGVIVNIDNYNDPRAAMEAIEKAKAESLQVVLVASQMNLSHDPMIVAADGIVIENAGLVSHGAQRARELGRGAIGGIRSKHLKTGERVRFDPASRKILRLLEEEL